MEFSPSITFLVPQTVAVKRVLVVSDIQTTRMLTLG